MLDRDPADPPVDPDNPMPVIAGSARWAEYDGVEIYADYTVNTVTETFDVSRMYLAGVAQVDMPLSPSPAVTYYHGDQIGSTRAMTDPDAGVSTRVTYTAFGEILESSGTVDTRYLYAGKHGYEAGLIDDWPFVHVGARWYDPMSGRFLQRDPIGIDGGLNVYAYVGSQPASSVDPSGHGAGAWLLTGQWNPTQEVYDAAANAMWNQFNAGPAVAGGVGGVTMAIYGGIKGGILGSAGGPPGIVAGALAGCMIGYVEGMYGGVLTWYLYDALM